MAIASIGRIVSGIYRSAALVLTDAQESPLLLDSAGLLRTATTSTLVSVASISRANIEASLNGNNTIIAAPGVGVRIRIYHFNFLTRAAVNVRLLSGANNYSGLYNFGARSGMAFDAPGGVIPFDLGLNEAFIINLSSATGIDGFVLYTTA